MWTARFWQRMNQMVNQKGREVAVNQDGTEGDNSTESSFVITTVLSICHSYDGLSRCLRDKMFAFTGDCVDFPTIVFRTIGAFSPLSALLLPWCLWCKNTPTASVTLTTRRLRHFGLLALHRMLGFVSFLPNSNRNQYLLFFRWQFQVLFFSIHIMKGFLQFHI